MFAVVLSACTPIKKKSESVFPSLTKDFSFSEEETLLVRKPAKIKEYVSSEKGFGEYLAGRHARNISDIDVAADYYCSALEKDPENASLLRHAYVLMASKKRIKEAANFARKALKENGAGHSLPILIITVEAANESNFEAAKEQLKRLKSYGFGRFLKPLMTAWLSVGKDETDKALKELEPLKKIPELSSLYHFHSGLINDLAERHKKAAEHYEKTLSNSGGMSLRAIQVIGNFYRRTDNKEKAFELVSKYMKIHSDSLTIKKIYNRFNTDVVMERIVNSAKDGLAEALFGLAATMSQNHEYNSGLLLANLSLVLDNDFSLAQILLGDILEVLDRPQDAIKVYDSISPDADIYFSARLRTAASLEKLNDIEAAVKLFKMLAKEYPEQSGPFRDLGDILRINGRYKEAAEAYNSAIAKIKDIKSYHWTIFYTLGIAQERAGNWKAAEKALLKALELEPNQPLLLNYLGYSWLQQGINVEQSIEMIKEAVKQRPNDGFIVDSLGWALIKKGDFKQAVGFLEKAIELEPGNAVINDHLGDAYWRVGRKKEAHYQWLRAVSLAKEGELENEADTKEKLKHGLPPLPEKIKEEPVAPVEKPAETTAKSDKKKETDVSK